MPRVEGYGDPRVRPAALPNARQSSAETFESSGGATGEALSRLGSVGAQQGLALYAEGSRAHAEAARVAQQRADQIANLGTLRQLNDLEHGLLYDPDHGLLLQTGKAPMAGRDAALDAFDQRAGELSAGLTNDEQRLFLEQQIVQRRDSMRQRVDVYAAGQLRDFEAKELDASLASFASTAIANASFPDKVDEQLHLAMAAIDSDAMQFRLGPEARAQLKVQTQSAVYEGIVGRLVEQQKAPAAREYFEAAREADQLTGPAIARIEAKLKDADTDQQGLDAADQIWNSLAPPEGADDAPISLDAMEREARARFAKDPATLKTTISYLRDRLQGVNAGRKARSDAREDTVWSAVMAGQPLNQVRTLPAFSQLDGRTQNTIRDYFSAQAERAEAKAAAREGRADAAESRADRADARKERQIDRAGWGTYFDLLQDPEALASMSRADITRKLPEIGPQHVQRLLNEQEQLQRAGATAAARDAAVRAVTMDVTRFNEIAAEAGYTYATEKTRGQLNPEQRANLGALLGAVKEEIGRQQQQGKTPRTLTDEEKEGVMRKLLDRRVMLNTWGSDESVPAVLVRGEGRTNAYVPIAQIPSGPGSILEQSLAELRKLYPGLNDQRLKALYGSRIERAYGRRLVNGTREEIEAILRGTD